MIGIHIKSDSDDIVKSIKYAHDIGCSFVQIFNDTKTDTMQVKKILKELNMKLYVHGPYTINIARRYNKFGWRTKYIDTEINIAQECGASGIIFHFGNAKGITKEEAYRNMIKNISHMSKNIKKKNFMVLLENTAGQGEDTGDDIEEIGKFFDIVQNRLHIKNIKICLDTCHLFAAGYDIRTIESSKKIIKKIHEKIGLKNIGLLHLNDSMNDINTHKDRHTNIGSGFIGKDGLKFFFDFFTNIKIGSILETPLDNCVNDIKILS